MLAELKQISSRSTDSFWRSLRRIRHSWTIEKHWGPEEFILSYIPSHPIVAYPEVGYGSHTAAFQAACALNGLQLKRAEGTISNIIRGNQTIGKLRGVLTSLNGLKAIKICGSKALTGQQLRSANLPVPEQRVFSGSEIEEGLCAAADRSFDIVVKPSRGSGGFGITTKIRNESEFRAAWAYALQGPTLAFGPSSRAAQEPPEIIVESKFVGIDVRAVVVDGRFICAVSRVPAHVIGNGISKIPELIMQKNTARQANPYHRKYPTRIGERLSRRLAAVGRTLDDILPEAVPFVLSDVCNCHEGGEACDITDLIPGRFVRIAEAAARAIPQLRVAGVDLMVSGLDDFAQAVVIEINTHPNFAVNHTCFRGTPRNPAEAVVRAMIETPLSRTPWT